MKFVFDQNQPIVRLYSIDGIESPGDPISVYTYDFLRFLYGSDCWQIRPDSIVVPTKDGKHKSLTYEDAWSITKEENGISIERVPLEQVPETLRRDLTDFSKPATNTRTQIGSGNSGGSAVGSARYRNDQS